MLQAAEQEERLSNLTIVTTDLFPELVEWIRSGKVAATLYQRPLTQGRLALQALYQYLLNGTCPAPRIAVAPHVVMRANPRNDPDNDRSGPSDEPDDLFLYLSWYYPGWAGFAYDLWPGQPPDRPEDDDG